MRRLKVGSSIGYNESKGLLLVMAVLCCSFGSFSCALVAPPASFVKSAPAVALAGDFQVQQKQSNHLKMLSIWVDI